MQKFEQQAVRNRIHRELKRDAPLSIVANNIMQLMEELGISAAVDVSQHPISAGGTARVATVIGDTLTLGIVAC